MDERQPVDILSLENDLGRRIARPFWVRVPFFYWGILLGCLGFSVYLVSIFLSILRLILLQEHLFVQTIRELMWVSGVPTTLGVALIAIHLGMMLPRKRRMTNRSVSECASPPTLTVALTAYNDEESIFDAVKDFSSHPWVRRVIVVSNNSSDRTMERAA